ncbi:very low-density lipoprotein receptor-like [Lytechinus variegatus]|uniref:very low-density lipoprotein receptor-like n=1 Tax=Lytechinus variegatus TaxID=7654 RepID=UPI001BB1A53A|nr:very low-density lipoprotein receptor-like [Lytechinus variegatus]
MLPWAVAFDNRSRTVFWSDAVLDAIFRANIDGTDQRIIVDNLGYPAGLSIDTVNDRIYWTDRELDVVGSSTLNGTDRTVLVNSGLTTPEGITVSTRNNLLFWVDRGDNNNPGTIERVNTAGSQRMTIVSGELDYPTAVSLNHDEDRLYWADFGPGHVASVTINGNDRREHVTKVQGFSFIKPYGLALLGREDKIFYSDHTQKVILEIDKSRRSDQTEITIQGNEGQFRDLTHIFISEFSEVICDPESKSAAPQQPPCPSTPASMTKMTTIVQDSTTTIIVSENPNHTTTIAGSSTMSTPINSTTDGNQDLPQPMFILVISGGSIIGVLIITLIITIGIKIGRDRSPSVESTKSSNAALPDRPPSYLEPDPIRTNINQPSHIYDTPDGSGLYQNTTGVDGGFSETPVIGDSSGYTEPYPYAYSYLDRPESRQTEPPPTYLNGGVWVPGQNRR